MRKILILSIALLLSTVSLSHWVSASDYVTPVADEESITYEIAVDYLTEDDYVAAALALEQSGITDSIEQEEFVKLFLIDIVVNQSSIESDFSYTSSYYGVNLNTAEKKLVAKHPVEATQNYQSAKIAKEKTIEKYKKNGYQDASDAFRHAMWNAELTTRIGAGRAKVWTDAHEQGVTDKLDKSMDMFNNNLGRTIGVNYKKGETRKIADAVHKAIKQGKGRMIVNKKLVATR